jgi:chromosome segregation ATPase
MIQAVIDATNVYIKELEGAYKALEEARDKQSASTQDLSTKQTALLQEEKRLQEWLAEINKKRDEVDQLAQMLYSKEGVIEKRREELVQEERRIETKRVALETLEKSVDEKSKQLEAREKRIDEVEALEKVLLKEREALSEKKTMLDAREKNLESEKARLQRLISP